MSTRYRTFHETEVEHFREHPSELPAYLEIALEEASNDGDWGAFLEAVRVAAESKGGLGDLAEKLECSRPTLYKTLSKQGNPRLQTLGGILAQLGFRLSLTTHSGK